MGNIVVETESKVAGTPVLTTVTSLLTYDGPNLASIDFDAQKVLNTNLSQLNTVIGGALTRLTATETATTTNTTNLSTLQTQVDNLDTADIIYNTSLTQNCFDFSSATDLDDILQLLIDQICTNKTDIATINSTSVGKPWTSDYEIVFEDWVDSGLAIIGTSGLNVTIDQGVTMIDGSRIDKAQDTLVMTATKDNYIDLQFDGDYDIKAVTVGAAAPTLGTAEMRLYKITTDATSVTGTTDLRRTTAFDGDDVFAVDSLSNDRLKDSGVSAASYTLVNATVNSKGIITTMSSGDGSMSNNYYPRRTAAGTWSNSTLYDNGTNLGIGTTDPQEELTMASGKTFAINLPVPSGIGTSLQSGGSLVDATTYYYVVTALDGTGETIASSEVSDTTATPNLTIRVTWSAVTGAVTYRVYKGTATGTYTEYFTVTAPTVQYDDDATVGTAGSPPSSTTAYAVKLGGSPSWVLDNFGIGTGNPTDMVHVLRTQNATTRTLVENTDSTGAAARSGYKLQETATKSAAINLYNTSFANSFIQNKLVILTNDNAAGMLLLNNLNSGPIDFAINVDDDVVAATDILFRVDLKGVAIGTTSFGTSAQSVLSIGIGVEPTTSPSDIIQVYAKDSSLGSANATLALRTEQAVEAIGTFTASHKLRVWLNGVEYHISLDAV